MAEENIVSVIMPTYNCGKYIAESIKSVCMQTVGDWELWIIDDASTDDTWQIVQPFLADERIHYSRLPENAGPAESRNQGLRLAKGRFVAFLDSDDVWMPNKLERQLAFMEQKGLDTCHFCCTTYLKMDEAGNSLHTKVCPYPEVGYWKTYFLSNPIGNSTTLYDRRYFGELSVPNIRKRNDFALWLRMLRNGDKCYGLDELLVKYRVRKNSVSSARISLAKYHWQLYRQIEGHSLAVAALGMLCWAVVKGTGIGLRIKREA